MGLLAKADLVSYCNIYMYHIHTLSPNPYTRLYVNYISVKLGKVTLGPDVRKPYLESRAGNGD